jgi:hypothetical protein
MSFLEYDSQPLNSFTISDINNNIPQDIINWKNKIESPEFVSKVQTFLPSISNFEQKLLDQTAGKKIQKNTKKYKNKRYGKTRKYFKKGGENSSINDIKMILSVVLLVLLLVVKADDVPNFFNDLVLYPQAMFNYLVIPFIGVMNNLLEATNIKQSLGYEIIQKTTSSILIPTGIATYNKLIQSLTGDPLVLNGMWALYLNGGKLFNYLESMISTKQGIPQAQVLPVAQVEIQKTINTLQKDLEKEANEIIKPKQLPNKASSLIDNINQKMIELPVGSKLLINENESLCK